MKRYIVLLSLLLLAGFAFANPLLGEWQRKSIDGIDKNGDVILKTQDTYIFQEDGWVRIIDKNSRHEYKYEVNENLLFIYKSDYPTMYFFLDKEPNRIIVGSIEAGKTEPPYWFADFASPFFLIKNSSDN